MHPITMLVKPWGEGQGDHVVINVDEFDPSFHVPFDAAEKPAEVVPETGADTEPKAATAAELKEALTARGIAFRGNASKADLQALLDAAPAE